MPSQERLVALTATLKKRVEDIRSYSSAFFQVRILTKGALIVLSAIVAAGQAFKGWHKTEIMISIFAIVVAALTALDAWIKPGDKWRISTNYLAQFDGLYRRALGLQPTDDVGINTLDNAVQDLEKSWINDTTY